MTPTSPDLVVSLLAGLAGWAARSAALGVIAGVALALLRVKRVTLRLTVWSIVLVAALAMPVLATTLPGIRWQLPVALTTALAPLEKPMSPVDVALIPVAAAAPSTIGEVPSIAPDVRTLEASTSARRASSWPQLVLTLYLAGVLVLVARLAMGMRATGRLLHSSAAINDAATLGRLQRHATALGLVAAPALRQASSLVVPITTSIVRPVLLLPIDWRDWSEDAMEAVMRHELAHIARRDALVQGLALIHRALLWFSPFSWLLHARLAQLAEYASDEAVLNSGIDRESYAATLVGFIAAVRLERGSANWQVAMARRSGAESRIERVLNWRGAGKRVTLWAAAFLALVAIPVALVIAAARPTTEDLNLPKLPPMETFNAVPPSSDLGAATLPAGDPATAVIQTPIARTAAAVERPVATDIKTIADSMLEKAHSQLNQAVTWSADRAAMFQQLVDRARKIKNDLRVKGEIGTVAPLDVNAHQGTLDKVEASATADRKRSVTSVSESEINLVKTQFSAAVRVLDGVEKKFDVGLSSVQELDDALMGALLVLDPAARGGVRHQVRLMATGLPAPVSGPVRHDQQHEPYQAQATSEDSTAVLVDVLVKDAAGAILPGLKPDEFHVFEDGAEQKIAAVTLIDGTKPYYIVSYTPPARPAGSNAKPQYHTIEVRVSRSGATVIARKGYFDGEGRGVEAVVALPPDDEIFAEGAHRPGEKGAKAPVLFADPKPMYTPDAIRAKIQGTVTVEAIVDLDGTIKKARVIKSLDKEYGLDDQALQAARRWEFAPGTIDGKPARFVVTFDLTFTLR